VPLRADCRSDAGPRTARGRGPGRNARPVRAGANERLRHVSWIDPNFVDLNVLDPNSNDDHAPSDIRAGEAFVVEIYDALRNSAEWEDTMLVVGYDEHGGFYDHVAPPPLPFDDGSGYAT
jgi:phospholipase C